MSEDLNSDEDTATRIIDEFRETTPTPSQRDWNALIAAHPKFAGEIADVALLDRTEVHLDESDLAAPLDQEMFKSSVSEAISVLYEIPSAALVAAQRTIASVQGPSVRALAREVGLGSASALLSGVLVGSIEAPRRVVNFLAEKWGSTAMVLAECFRRASEAATVPAFKAETDKPDLATQPTSWENAVKSLKLPQQETERLLQLRD